MHKPLVLKMFPVVPFPVVPFLFVAFLLSAACSTQDGPFTAVGRPETPLYEARPQCKEANRAEDGSVLWPAYEKCMEKLGWVKQTTPRSPAPYSGGGGGGASY